MNYSLQLYSVRDIAESNFAAALKQVKAIGYDGVESAGFFGLESSEVVRLLEENGLRLLGTHSSAYDLTEGKIDSTIAFHKAIGNKNYVIPAMDISSREKRDEAIKIINYALPRLKAEGISLAFHNHSAEYLPGEEGVSFMQRLEMETDIDFEIDTYWAWNAGKDPREELLRLRDRIKLIHLKDGLSGGEGKALGEGSVPLESIIKTAREIDAEIIVESETLDPTGPEEVTRCINYLRRVNI